MSLGQNRQCMMMWPCWLQKIQWCSDILGLLVVEVVMSSSAASA